MESDPESGDSPNSPIQPCPWCEDFVDVSDSEPLAKISCPHCAGEMQVRGAIGQFELLSVAGRGGMGVVYKALDAGLHRQVALKLLRKDHSDNATLISQLETEAAITASINHPHVVKVFSTGVDNGRFYIAMELVDKGSLDDLIRIQGRVPEAQVLQVGSQIAQGLRAAYHHGLIHRDVKPGNILFASATTAKIVDFGLAIFASEEEKVRGEIWGTPYYVAPEKLDQKPEDFRSDIYSLGATLFHALAGRPPFEAESASMVALKHLKNQPVSLQAYAPHVSGRMSYIINRTLLKDPDKRYQSYDELIEHFQYAQEELLANSGAKSQPTRVVLDSGAIEKAWGVMTIVMIAVLAIAVILGIIFRDSIFKSEESKSGLAVSTPAAAVVNEADAPLKKAREMLLNNDPLGAAAEFRKIATQPKQNKTVALIAMMQAGLSELEAGDLPAAKATFNQVTKNGHPESKNPEEKQLGEFLVETARKLTSESLVTLKSLGEINKGDPKAFAFLLHGLKDWHLGKPEESVALLREFRKAAPVEAHAWMAELKPVVGRYIDDLTKLQMGAARLKAAQTPEQKAEIIAELKAMKGPLESKVQEVLKPFEADIAPAQSQ